MSPNEKQEENLVIFLLCSKLLGIYLNLTLAALASCLNYFTSLQVVDIEGKGRGVVAARNFERDEFIVEYAGELVNITTAKQRESLYELDEQVGCYMYYFIYQNKQYW